MLIARALRYSYAVPWCVPQWGWSEFRASVAGSLSVRTTSPLLFGDAASEAIGAAYAIPVGQGRMAIELGLRGLGVGPSDDVVLPSYVCTSVLRAVQHVGARPVFADVGVGLNMTLETVLVALTPRTRCVIIPHLFGAPAPIGAIDRALRQRRIPVLDDAAQALGATVEGRPVGSFGACGILSCGPGKPLAGSGGGVLVTNDRALFERASAIARPDGGVNAARKRVWNFWAQRRFRRISLPLQVLVNRLGRSADRLEEADYDVEAMAEVEAKVCLAQLGRVGQTTAWRRLNAAAMLAAIGPLAGCNVVDTGPGTASIKLALVLPKGGPSADEVIEAFADGGVECQRGYKPCHLQVEGAEGNVPYTDAVWQRVVCVPLETRLRSAGRLVQALARLHPASSMVADSRAPASGRP